MKFFPHLVLGILILILVFLQASSAAGSSTVSAGFEVKDSGGNVLPDTLVIVQGITNTGFSESKLTDSAGKASFALNKDEFFIYIIYKLSYKEQTAGFFTIGDRNFSITLEKLPEDQWYFYRVNSHSQNGVSLNRHLYLMELIFSQIKTRIKLQIQNHKLQINLKLLNSKFTIFYNLRF